MNVCLINSVMHLRVLTLSFDVTHDFKSQTMIGCFKIFSFGLADKIILVLLNMKVRISLTMIMT